MLSILIPIYNFDVRPLVTDLLNQAEAVGQAFEILLFDDGSRPEVRSLNQSLAALPHVRYQDMPHNLGRAAIRNFLADSARYEFLLFLDCDSRPPDDQFLARYLAALPYAGILYGGRSYAPTPPAAADYYLHWYYGQQREVSTAVERGRRPYHGFMTNNFVAPRPLFQQLRFDESLRQYGHEDTVFGLELARLGIPILHLDNPLEHIGLEPAGEFLRKQRLAVENLAVLLESYPDLDTRLLHTWRRLEKWKLSPLLVPILRPLAPVLRRALLGKSPALKALDLLKLYWLGEAIRRNGRR